VAGPYIPPIDSRRGGFVGGLRLNLGRFSTRQGYGNDYSEEDEYNNNYRSQSNNH